MILSAAECADRQTQTTDKHTDTPIAISCPPTVGKVTIPRVKSVKVTIRYTDFNIKSSVSVDQVGFTGLRTPSVRGQTIVTIGNVCRRLSSVGVVCNTSRRACRKFHPRRQSNYSSTVTLQGGPVVLRPVRATPCLLSIIASKLLP